MKFHGIALVAATTFLLAITLIPAASAQSYKMTTQIAPGVATPDKVETSIGTLHLTDGVPDADTTEKIYDNLDRSRALQAYLLAIPIVNQASMRETLRSFGPDNQTDVIWETLVDSKTVELTANDNVIYNFIWLDTHKGPLVVEVPPRVLGLIDDFWYRWVADIGITGPDKGKGGKYLVLPPGYDGDVPDGYFVVQSETYNVWNFMRGYLDKGVKAASDNIRDNLKVYPLSRAENQPAMEFIIDFKPKLEKISRPPGRNTRAMPRKAAAGSLLHCNAALANTRSTLLSASGRWSRSAHRQPGRRSRQRVGERSTRSDAVGAVRRSEAERFRTYRWRRRPA
mgnify:CR=1 FL=1